MTLYAVYLKKYTFASAAEQTWSIYSFGVKNIFIKTEYIPSRIFLYQKKVFELI